MIFLNTLALCIALAGAETIHGVIRAAVIVPQVGKKRALKISIVTGSLLAFIVCFFFVPTIGVTSQFQLLTIGFVAALFMLSFDLLFAKLVLKRSFTKSLKDLNPRTGNYLIFGLALLVTYPLLVMYLKGI